MNLFKYDDDKFSAIINASDKEEAKCILHYHVWDKTNNEPNLTGEMCSINLHLGVIDFTNKLDK